MRTNDPLHLFGPAFTDDYVDGFYKGMTHLAKGYVLVPTGFAVIAVRLKRYPDFPLETLT